MPRNTNLTLPSNKNAKLNPIYFIVGSCAPFPDVVNGNVQYNQDKVDGRYPKGTVISISCDPGYSVVDGKSEAPCILRLWLGALHTKCNRM